MKLIKKLVLVMTLVFTMLLSFACGSEVKLTFEKSNYELKVGESFELKPVVTGSESLVEYSFDKEGIVEKNENTIVAKAVGEVVITASLKDVEGISATIKVVVKAEEHTHVYDKEVVEDKYLKSNATTESAAVYYKSCECGEFDKELSETFEHGEPLKPMVVLVNKIECSLGQELELNKGDEKELVITVLPDNATNKEVSVVSENPEICKVEDNKIIALQKGSAKLTIKALDESNVSIEIIITVKDNSEEELGKYMEEFLETFPEETMDTLPQGNEIYNITYDFEKVINSKGELSREQFDTEITGKVILSIGESSLEKEVSILVYGTFTDEIVKEFMDALPKEVNESIKFLRSSEKYGGTKILAMESSMPEYLTKSGMYTRPFHDEVVMIRINIRTTEPKVSRYYDIPVNVAGETIEYKTNAVMEWLFGEYKENSVLYYDSPAFPTTCDTYDATIKWLDSKGDDLDFSKVAQDPVLGESVVFSAKITIRGETYTQTADYFVWNKYYQSDEEKLDDFVKAINWQDIRAYQYTSAAYYETNYGYLPFYIPGESVINTDYMCELTYGRCRTGIIKKSTEYIVVHDTAGGAPTHTAESFALDLRNQNNKENNQYISWHFTVGEDGVFQSLPLDEVAYHAGDGSYEYGDVYYNSTYKKADCIGGGNRNGIGIESCINMGADYNVTLRKLAKLVAELLLQYNLSFDRIKQHWHFSGKDCPGVIRHTGRWQEFRNLVKIEYFAKTQLKDSTFEWKSLTPDLMDNTGKVIVKTGAPMTLKYSVKASYNGVTKEYEFSSNTLKLEDLIGKDLTGTSKEY